MTPATFMDVRRARYDSLLKTMEWRAFAYNAKSAANFSCQLCRRGGAGVELNVHHWAYEADRMPWEYAPHEIAVLCRGCHEQLHQRLQEFRKFIFPRLTPRTFQVLNGALKVGLEQNDGLEFVHAIANLVATPGAIRRFAHDWK